MNAVLRRLSARLIALLLAFAPVARAQEGEPAEGEQMPLYSQAELDQMLAPIALYPDTLLSQLLMAATYPLEVVEAARWSRGHPDLKGEQAVRAADGQRWDPSVKSMVAFPDILRRMDEDLEWTRDLGDAFLAQQEQVMDTIQALRERAYEEGNLRSNDHLEVERQREVIYVRDRYPDVVYVPWYDPWYVYGAWWWPSYRPVYWDPWPGYYRSSYFWRPSYFYWGPTIVVGHGFYYGHCDWRARQIRIVESPPFYYRRPPPVRHVWVHEYRHRRGVPYRDIRVHERYADKYARPPRVERPRRPDAQPGADGKPVEPRERGGRHTQGPVRADTGAGSGLVRGASATGPRPDRSGRAEPADRQQDDAREQPRGLSESPRAQGPTRPRDSAPRQDTPRAPNSGTGASGTPTVRMPYETPPSRGGDAAPAERSQDRPARRVETPRAAGPTSRSQEPSSTRGTSGPQRGYEASPQRSQAAEPQRSYQPAPQRSYTSPAPQRSYSAPEPAEPRGSAPARAPRSEPSRAPRAERATSQSRNDAGGASRQPSTRRERVAQRG
jgi:hypothetical protein